VASDVAGLGLRLADPLVGIALGATAVAAGLCLWDPRAAGRAWSTFRLYAAGLLAIGLTMHALELSPARFGWTVAPLLAVYVLLASGLGRAAPRLTEVWRDLRLPRPEAWPAAWFLPVQCVVGCVVVALSVGLACGFDTLGERLVGPLAAAVVLAAAVLSAGGTSGRWGIDLRYASLVLGVVVVAELGWAVLDPAGPAPWLYRSALLTVAVALLTGVYGVGLGRLAPPASGGRQPPGEHPPIEAGWAECGQRIGPVLGALATLLLAGVLVQENLLYDGQRQRAPLALPVVVLVIFAVLELIAVAVWYAVAPGRDPLRLSERGRTVYVYAGEVLLVLLFVHVRLTVPELFGEIGRKYWALIVMAIAFAGAGLSELFHRRGLRVLAEPLRYTGIFLPLLPLLVFWARPHPALLGLADRHAPGLRPLLESLTRLPTDYGNHALLWFLLGGIYTFVAVTRRSFNWALLAALAANLGVWAWLYDREVTLLVHPQLWLIPTALIVLAAEHLNRDRLTGAQSTALRYLAVSVIYVSSSADMFLAGLGNSVVLPLVLAVLAVLGVLLGILLRVRAFLILGVTFLFLVVFAQIWHAAVDRAQTWVWWASGIVLGAGILALFAVFEKRRNDVLRVLEEIKKWDS
jgi:hypothetical protein